MTKWIMSISAIVAGTLMVVPTVLPWMRRLAERGRHMYNPTAHTDLILVVGSRSVDADVLMRRMGGVGLVLIVVGVFVIWRR